MLGFHKKCVELVHGLWQKVMKGFKHINHPATVYFYIGQYVQLNAKLKKMKKTIATLVAVVVIVAVIDVAVAAATSPPHVKGQQQTSITMTEYPKQPVIVGQDYNVAGHLTSSGTGLASKVVFEEWQLNGTWVPNGGNVTTNPVGLFY